MCECSPALSFHSFFISIMLKSVTPLTAKCQQWQTKIFSLVYMITRSMFEYYRLLIGRVYKVNPWLSSGHRCCGSCRQNRQIPADYEKFSNNWIKLNFQLTEQLSECLCINFVPSCRSLGWLIVWIFCYAFFGGCVFQLKWLRSVNSAQARSMRIIPAVRSV